VVIAYFVARDVARKPEGTPPKKHEGRYVWFAAMFGFGTLFWYLASVGSVWLIAQVMSVFFVLLAIHEAFNKARPLIMGLLVGAAFWCRLPAILGVLFFAVLIISRQANPAWIGKIRSALKPLVLLAVGAGVFVGLDMAYNFVRFGALFDVGYWMIPGVL
jgi:hypothetical protein